MATFQVDSWEPTFPDPRPANWVAFVCRAGQCDVLSNRPLSPAQCTQLAGWLDRYPPREPADQASYVYLGLANRWLPLLPDGQTSQRGVTGVGSGIGLGEPEGAVASTVAQVLAAAVKQLHPSNGSDRDSE